MVATLTLLIGITMLVVKAVKADNEAAKEKAKNMSELNEKTKELIDTTKSLEDEINSLTDKMKSDEIEWEVSWDRGEKIEVV